MGFPLYKITIKSPGGERGRAENPFGVSVATRVLRLVYKQLSFSLYAYGGEDQGLSPQNTPCEA